HRGWIVLDTERGVPHARWRQILAEQVVLAQLHPCRRRLMERLLIDEVAGEPAFAAQIHLLLAVDRLDEAMLRGPDWAEHHLTLNHPVTALQVLDEVVPHVGRSAIDLEERARLFLGHVTALLAARPTDPQTSRSLAKATRLSQTPEFAA